MGEIRDVVVPIYELRGPDWKGLGSASIVASFGTTAIFATARHVIEAIVDELEGPRRAYPKLSRVVAIVGSAEKTFVAEVQQLQISEFSDVGFGLLVAPEGRTFGPCLALDPSPVLPGTLLHTLGYSDLPLSHRQDWENQEFSVRLEFHLQSRECRSIDRHLGGIRHLKWPVFQVDTFFDSGMSGGPIVELRENEPVVRGVICSDITTRGDLRAGGGGEAMASELWPILMMPFRFNLTFSGEDGTDLEIRTMLDLLRERFIVDRGNTVRDFIWVPDGETVVASWRGIPGRLVAPLERSA